MACRRVISSSERHAARIQGKMDHFVNILYLPNVNPFFHHTYSRHDQRGMVNSSDRKKLCESKASQERKIIFLKKIKEFGFFVCDGFWLVKENTCLSG